VAENAEAERSGLIHVVIIWRAASAWIRPQRPRPGRAGRAAGHQLVPVSAPPAARAVRRESGVGGRRTSLSA
jgi:hypothetical protein